MSFSILENPFALLGLADDASPAEVARRAREVGSPEAVSASRTLISPRSRLQAEVTFLPGASQAEMWTCLDALRSGRMPDLSGFSDAARANVLAHRASSGKASPDDLRRLASLQEGLENGLASALARSHGKSGLPLVSDEALGQATGHLRSQHADALAGAALAMPDGAVFLSSLIAFAEGGVSARLMFLREVASAWERACLGSLSELDEHAERIETKLRADPDPVSAEQLAKAVTTWAAATKPPRSACAALSLPHGPSAEHYTRWRSLALFLANEHDALPESLAVLEALAGSFEPQGADGERLAEDLFILRRRIAGGEGLPAIRRLLAAIAAVNESPSVLRESWLENGKLLSSAPPVAAELHDAFAAAARSSATSLPWVLLRGVSLRLQNELVATAAALETTLLALRLASGNKAADEIRPMLETDERRLRAILLERDIAVAMSAKRFGEARELIPKIIPLLEDEKERAPYRNALTKLRNRHFRKVTGGVFWAIMGVLIVWGLSQSKPDQVPAGGTAASRPVQALQGFQSPPAAVTPIPGRPADLIETQPSVGVTLLTRAELRWCSYRKAAADAAEAWLARMKPGPGNSGHATDRYNTAVDAFNAYIQPMNQACYQRQFLVSDQRVVEAEVAASSSLLSERGRRAVQTAYDSFVPPPVAAPRYAPAPAVPVAPSVPPAAYPAPAPADSAWLQPSKAYLDGQQDRRVWEAWIGGLSGGMREGAEWWAGIRSSARPPQCSAAPSASDQQAAVVGCNAARVRLAPSDRRRRSEPDYRQGWNNP